MGREAGLDALENDIQSNSLSSYGNSDLCGTVPEMVTTKGSISTEGETLQVSVLPYRCSICPPCCVCLGCCAADFGNHGETYESSCIYI